MVKACELSESEQVSIKHFRPTSLSYAEIGRQIGCNKSVTFKVLKKLELAGSVEKRRKCGRPKIGKERSVTCPQSFSTAEERHE